jgi:hypothetical protein
MVPESYIIVWRPDLGRWFIVQRDGESRLPPDPKRPARNVRLQADADARAAYARNNHYRVVAESELPDYGITRPGMPMMQYSPNRIPCSVCGTKILRTEQQLPRHMVELRSPDPTFVGKRVVSVECIAGFRPRG